MFLDFYSLISSEIIYPVHLFGTLGYHSAVDSEEQAVLAETVAHSLN